MMGASVHIRFHGEAVYSIITMMRAEKLRWNDVELSLKLVIYIKTVIKHRMAPILSN